MADTGEAGESEAVQRSLPEAVRAAGNMTTVDAGAYRVSILVVLALLVSSVGARAQRGYSLVANGQNPTGSLSRGQVSDLFLKRSTRWPDGSAALPVDQLATSEVRQRFSQDVHRRKTSAVKSYWQRQIFSGRGTPPTELSSDGEVLDFVRSNRAAIGYVRAGVALGPGVKTLRIE